MENNYNKEQKLIPAKEETEKNILRIVIQNTCNAYKETCKELKASGEKYAKPALNGGEEYTIFG